MNENNAEPSPARHLKDASARVRDAEQLVLLLDYDGTLVPLARTPNWPVPMQKSSSCFWP